MSSIFLRELGLYDSKILDVDTYLFSKYSGQGASDFFYRILNEPNRLPLGDKVVPERFLKIIAYVGEQISSTSGTSLVLRAVNCLSQMKRLGPLKILFVARFLTTRRN